MNFPKTLTTLYLLLLFCFSGLFQNSSFAQCANADFENGTLSGWTGTWGDGTCSGVITFGVCAGCWYPDPYQNSGLNQGPNNQLPTGLPVKNHFIMSSGTDPYGGFPSVYSPGSFSAVLGNAHADDAGHGGGESMSYSFLVNSSNCNFTYHYAVVLDDGGHQLPGEQPYFKIKMTDGSNNPISCAAYDVDATTAASIGGFTNIGSLYYKPWSSVFIPLNNYIGQTVTIEFSTRDCKPTGCDGGHWAYAYIDAECAPLQILSSSPDICGGQNVTLTAPAGAATYSWTGPGVIPPGNTQVVSVNMAGQYTVNMTTFGTVPCTFSLDTVILGNPGNPNANFSFTDVCLGNPTIFTDLSTPVDSITAWAWDFDNNGTTDATGQNPSYTFPSPGTYQVKLTVTWPPCLDDTIIDVTVGNDLTILISPSNPSICPGGSISLTASGATTYSWSPATGLSGTTGATVTASPSSTTVYTVTGISGSCSGLENVTVSVGSSLSAGVSCTSETTSGANDGSSSVTPSGGTTPFTYLWSNTQTTQTITGLSAGTYSVTVTDASGCTATSSCAVAPGIQCPSCQLPGFQYLKEITIDNTGISSGYTNYQELIILDTQTPISQGKMNVAGNDIRFMDGDCSTPLCYYIESGINTASTQVWVMLPSLAANSSKTIYMFYGNSAATSQSNIGCIFQNILTVNSAISLGGVQNYDLIDIQAGGAITIPSGQLLTLNARKVTVSGTITGNGAGYGPQAGPGAGCFGGGSTGGSGGGYGGNGGTGGGCAGGPANGTPNGLDIDLGSGGGGSDCAADAPGGGALKITSSVAVINGSITVNGSTASYCCCGNSSEAAAGGSGGGILIQGDYVSGGATLSARGGNGAGSDAKEGGGGGGGGRVKIFYCKNNIFSGSANVNGGTPGAGGQSGQQAGATGTFTTNIFACEAISVGLEQFAVFADAGNDTIVCSGTFPSVGGPTVAGYSYSWSPGTGLSNDTISDPSVSLTNVSPTPLVTDYILTSVANGCTATDTVTVTVNAIPFSDAGADTSYCSGNTVTIGTGPGSGFIYSWSPSVGLSSSTISNPGVNLTNTSLTPSVNDFFVTTTYNNCSSSDTVTVTVNAMPVSAAGPDLTYCSGSTQLIGAPSVPGYTYLWSPSAGLSSDTVSNPTVIITNSGSSNIVTNYVVTTTSNGCVTSDTALVTVYPLPTSTFSAVGPICVEEGLIISYSGNADTATATFIWDFDSATFISNISGETYLVSWDTSGNKNITLTVIQNGCLSTQANVVVIVNPPNANAGPDQAFCSGGSTTIGIPANSAYTYSWSPPTGLSSSTVGNPTISLANTTPAQVTYDYIITTTYMGCVVTDTVQISVDPEPVPGVFAGGNICSGNSTLIGNASNSNYSYDWSPSTGLSSTTVSSPSVSLSYTGNSSSPDTVYSYVVTTTYVAYGCTVSDTVNVTVFQIPTSTFTSPDSVCIGETANIIYTGSATVGANYTWNFDGGLVSGFGSGPYDVVWNSPGTVVISLLVNEMAFSCPSTVTFFPVVVKPSPVSIAGNDVSFCSGGSASLGTASGPGYSYAWIPVTGLSDPSVSNPSITLVNTSANIQTTVYIVTTTSLGCSTSDSAKITVYPIPVASFSTPAGQCLSGNSFSFDNTGTYLNDATFLWDFGLAATPASSTAESPSAIVFGFSGTYPVSLTVDQYGCTHSVTDSVTVYPMPSASFAPNDSDGCSPLTVIFYSQVDMPVTYLWNFGDGQTSSLPGPTHTYLSQGTFPVSLVVTSAEACSTSYAGGNIYVYPKPDAAFSFTPDQITDLNPVAHFFDESTVNPQTWDWSFGDGEFSTDQNPVHSFPDTGAYLVSLIISNIFNCLDTTLDTLIILPDYNFFIPNAFTPNHDGKNDFFSPVAIGIDVSEYEMLIFDRWGELIFVTQSPSNPWDGTMDGNPVKEDVYVWVVTLRDVLRKAHSYMGHVTVVR